MSFNWATKIATTTRERAKPSMFNVAPSGSIKRLMRGSTLLFFSTQRIVVGSVAALKSKKKKDQKIYNDQVTFLSTSVIPLVDHKGILSWIKSKTAFTTVKGIAETAFDISLNQVKGMC